MPLLWHIYCRFLLCLLITTTHSAFGIDMFIACCILNLFRALLGHIFKPEAFRIALGQHTGSYWDLFFDSLNSSAAQERRRSIDVEKSTISVQMNSSPYDLFDDRHTIKRSSSYLGHLIRPLVWPITYYNKQYNTHLLVQTYKFWSIN